MSTGALVAGTAAARRVDPHPDLEGPDAGERLLDPAWVSAAITTAGLTRDW